MSRCHELQIRSCVMLVKKIQGEKHSETFEI